MKATPMPKTTCAICGNLYQWLWEEAFDKFGFGDGDGQVETATVVAVLRDAGYQVEWHPWGLHNTVIDSINKNGVERIPEFAEVGYDDPRKYLPKSIIRLLDEKLAPEAEVAA
jgi:hypothetical protein